MDTKQKRKKRKISQYKSVTSLHVPVHTVKSVLGHNIKTNLLVYPALMDSMLGYEMHHHDEYAVSHHNFTTPLRKDQS